MVIKSVLVRGAGPFPVDMLRYDGLFPFAQSDAMKIAQSFGPGRETARVEVELNGVKDPEWTPTVARWDTFGYKVEKVSTLGRVVS